TRWFERHASARARRCLCFWVRSGQRRLDASLQLNGCLSVQPFPPHRNKRGRSLMVLHPRLRGLLPTLLILCCCLVLPAAAFAATVSTDKADYAPGETVQITGTGWQPGEVVSVLLHEVPTRSPDITLTPTADGSGNITATHVVEEFDLGVSY